MQPEGADGADRLAPLYARAEAEALRTAEWYLAARVGKRRAARLLRCGALLGAAGGAVLPLLGIDGRWGCLSLLAAAACVACDRYLGLTSGWMRDVATAQAVRRRLETLRYDWAAESIRDGGEEEAAERRLGVLRRFSEDVTELVRVETADWMREFGPCGTTVADPARTPAAPPGPPPRRPRFPGEPQPGMRPTMPRQRPPETA
ncbi:SLATT domain-containing protein [Streptomyces sp. DSM 44938]|uniref:SLATT domain-containing protein n=2 Tax=Streptomyces litchfieldiae TaxID=3075543 RepID=A0ABU2MUP6_9ACTN|nr:SLATT domain-containing protein [Streptomyces sp. DSM 44938]MDT0345028.1 SLATT domain-containing protein [Streptomyces sp. DSM 44938]